MTANGTSVLVASVAVALLATAGARPSHAFAIGGSPPNQTVSIDVGDIGDTFKIDWAIDINGGAPSNDLTATSLWTVVGFTSTTLTLEIEIANTSVVGGANGLTQAAIHAFGIATAPDTTASFVTAGGTFDLVTAAPGPTQHFPGGFTGIDVCVFGSLQCATGPIDEGLQAGASDTLTIALSGSFGTGPEATLSFFPIQFDTNLTAQFETGGRASIPPPNVPPIPIPGALPMLIGGLAMMAGLARRKQRMAA
jgi:hypothetical protein